MAWLPDGEKNSNCLFVLGQLTNVTDGQTDRRTDTECRQLAALIYSIARQKRQIQIRYLLTETSTLH